MNMREAAKRAPWPINGFSASDQPFSVESAVHAYDYYGSETPISGDFTTLDREGAFV